MVELFKRIKKVFEMSPLEELEYATERINELKGGIKRIKWGIKNNIYIINPESVLLERMLRTPSKEIFNIKYLDEALADIKEREKEIEHLTGVQVGAREKLKEVV